MTMALIVHERYAAYSSCFKHLLHHPLLWRHPTHSIGSLNLQQQVQLISAHM